MSDLTDLLDEIQNRADKATEGPWDAYSVPASRGKAGYSAVEVSDTEVQVTRDAGGWSDANFIAHAREDVPRQEAGAPLGSRQCGDRGGHVGGGPVVLGGHQGGRGDGSALLPGSLGVM